MDDLEKQRLAFLYHYSQRVMLADDKLFRQEIDALMDLNSALTNAGLMQADGTLRDSFVEARDAARNGLRDRLDQGARREILDQLIAVMDADGERHPTEKAIIDEAAGVLGLSNP